MEKFGCGIDDHKRLEEELKVARARHAVLKAKVGRINGLKRELRALQQRNADLKMKKWERMQTN